MKIKLATIGVLVMLQVTVWASKGTVVWNSADLATGLTQWATSSSIRRVTLTV